MVISTTIYFSASNKYSYIFSVGASYFCLVPFSWRGQMLDLIYLLLGVGLFLLLGLYVVAADHL